MDRAERLYNADMSGSCGHSASCDFGAQNTVNFMNGSGATLGAGDNAGCSAMTASLGDSGGGISFTDPLGAWMNAVVDASVANPGDPSNLPPPQIQKE